MRRIKVTLTTASDGSTTLGYSGQVSGKLHSVTYVPDGTNPFANTADFAITCEKTGESLISRTNVSAGFTAYPRAPVSDAAGTASLYAAGGTAVQDRIGIGGDRIKVSVAQGGNSKTGVFYFILD
jgi:hypothetical protein